jgi:hypothetical protein
MNPLSRRVAKLEGDHARPYATHEDWIDYLDNPVGPPPPLDPALVHLLDELAPRTEDGE